MSTAPFPRPETTLLSRQPATRSLPPGLLRRVPDVAGCSEGRRLVGGHQHRGHSLPAPMHRETDGQACAKRGRRLCTVPPGARPPREHGAYVPARLGPLSCPRAQGHEAAPRREPRVLPGSARRLPEGDIRLVWGSWRGETPGSGRGVWVCVLCVRQRAVSVCERTHMCVCVYMTPWGKLGP